MSKLTRPFSELVADKTLSDQLMKDMAGRSQGDGTGRGILPTEINDLPRVVLMALGMRVLAAPEISQQLRDALTEEDAVVLGGSILLTAERRVGAVLCQRARLDVDYNFAQIRMRMSPSGPGDELDPVVH